MSLGQLAASPQISIYTMSVGQPASEIQKVKSVLALVKRKETFLAQSPLKTVSITQAVLATVNSVEELRTSEQSKKTSLSAWFQ